MHVEPDLELVAVPGLTDPSSPLRVDDRFVVPLAVCFVRVLVDERLEGGAVWPDLAVAGGSIWAER